MLPLGIKNWIPCCVVVGTEAAGTVKCPVATCRRQGIVSGIQLEDRRTFSGSARSTRRCASKCRSRGGRRDFSPAVRRRRTLRPELNSALRSCRTETESIEILKNSRVARQPNDSANLMTKWRADGQKQYFSRAHSDAYCLELSSSRALEKAQHKI